MGLGGIKKLFRRTSRRQELFQRLLRGLKIDSGYQDWIDNWERYAPAEAGPGPSVPVTIVVLGALSAADHAYWNTLDSADLRRQVMFAGAALPTAAIARALREAQAEHLIFLHAADRLSRIAFHRLQRALAARPEAALVYGDEDQIDREGRRFAPWFKPDFGPDLFLSQNGFGRAVLFRAASLRVVQLPEAGDLDTAVYHLALRVILAAGQDPLHCPGILVHVGGDPLATPKARVQHLKDPARRAAIEEFIAGSPSLSGASVDGPDAAGFFRLRHPVPAAPPLVSIVIPTRDRKDLLEQCINGLDRKTAYRNFEIIVVDNDSREPDTKAYFKALAQRADLRIVAAPGAFNYARLINLGAAQARGELLLALNNDTEAIEPGWLDELVGQALRPDVGLVGTLLLYPDRSVQHAGIIIGMGGVAQPIFAETPAGEPGYAARILVAQDLNAVTGACHIMRRELYNRLDGMDEAHLAVAYNDVDLCLRVREAGLRVIYTPFAALLHRHSASRGSDARPERLASFAWERDYMRARWAGALLDDPFFNPNLSLSGKKGRLATPPRVRLYRAPGERIKAPGHRP